MLFVGQLITENKQSSTIKSYLLAIRAVLKQDGINLKENKFLITSLTRACCLINDKVRTRLPIRKGLLGVIVRQVVQHFGVKLNQQYLSTLYQTLFCSAYFGLLRIGEVTSGKHPVLAGDVHIGMNKKKVLFLLRTSKTHWKNNKPQTVKITSERNANFTYKGRDNQFHLPCFHQLIKEYAQRRGPFRKTSVSTPYFVFADGTPVKPVHMQQCLKLMLKQAGYYSSRYRLQSMGFMLEGHWTCSS